MNLAGIAGPWGPQGGGAAAPFAASPRWAAANSAAGEAQASTCLDQTTAERRDASRGAMSLSVAMQTLIDSRRANP